MKALVVGWFSYENSDFTAGDALACDLVCEWLASAGFSWDVALAPPARGGVGLWRVEPEQYSHVVFVCGPFMQNAWEAQLFGRFANSCIVGVNLSLPVPLEVWNPFDYLLERDSSETARPDMTFLSCRPHVPVVGVCLVEPYDGALVAVADAAVEKLIASRELAIVRIDTRLDVNATGLRTRAEVESLLARMDAVVTTRLHGMVLSLKNGVPALVIDPEPAGTRIRRQAETIGWPAIFSAEAIDTESLRQALDYCLSTAARTKARECSNRAVAKVETMRRSFITTMRGLPSRTAKHDERVAFALSRGWRPSPGAMSE
jgi:hypothetical protein